MKKRTLFIAVILCIAFAASVAAVQTIQVGDIRTSAGWKATTAIPSYDVPVSFEITFSDHGKQSTSSTVYYTGVVNDNLWSYGLNPYNTKEIIVFDGSKLSAVPASTVAGKSEITGTATNTLGSNDTTKKVMLNDHRVMDLLGSDPNYPDKWLVSDGSTTFSVPKSEASLNFLEEVSKLPITVRMYEKGVLVGTHIDAMPGVPAQFIPGK